MKTKIITLLVLTIFTSTYAQFGPEQIITTNADGASSVYAADIDGDGNMDVLSASYLDNKIAWYENVGNGNFGPQHIITTNADGASSVYAEDIDGDGDMDVLSASFYDDKIAWYENTDGLGNFGPQQIITTSADGARSVYAADIDGDGEMDVLSASVLDGHLAWYENTDGLGNFSSQQIINVNYHTSVYATDIDNDGDIDVLSAGDDIAWYENDGNGIFGSQQIISTSGKSVYAEDLDGDGDMDVLSTYASQGGGFVKWYENDGAGNFGPQQILNYDAASSVYAADLDGDGDMDVLSAYPGDNFNPSHFLWYENDGEGNFGPQQFTSADGASSVYAVNLDGDGDMDVLSASGDDIAWYENLHPLGVNENTLSDFSVFPNPIKDVLNIQSETAITEIEIYNQLGQMVLSSTNQNTIDISSVSSGIYFIKIKDVNGIIGTKKVVKN